MERAQRGHNSLSVATQRALGINPRALGISPRDLDGKDSKQIADKLRAAATILLELADEIEFGKGGE